MVGLNNLSCWNWKASRYMEPCQNHKLPCRTELGCERILNHGDDFITNIFILYEYHNRFYHVRLSKKSSVVKNNEGITKYNLILRFTPIPFVTKHYLN